MQEVEVGSPELILVGILWSTMADYLSAFGKLKHCCAEYSCINGFLEFPGKMAQKAPETILYGDEDWC